MGIVPKGLDDMRQPVTSIITSILIDELIWGWWPQASCSEDRITLYLNQVICVGEGSVKIINFTSYCRLSSQVSQKYLDENYVHDVIDFIKTDPRLRLLSSVSFSLFCLSSNDVVIC